MSSCIAAGGCADIDSSADEAFGEFAQEVKVGSQLDCPNGINGACTVSNMPQLLQTSTLVDGDVSVMQPDGCYDTSMATVIQTALANRTSTQSLTGRTLQYNNIVAGTNGRNPPSATTKAYEQLSQSYRWAMLDHGQPVPDPNVDPYHFPEVLNDFSGTKLKFPTTCNPDVYGSCAWETLTASDFNGLAARDFTSGTSHVNNDYIKKLMSNGTAAMIAYGRYAPTATWSAALNGYRVTFSRTSQHKVAFSGYQTGSYPLRINDVGDGQQHNVTVTNDMSVLATVGGVSPSQVKQWSFPNGQSKQTFVKYDPAQGSDGMVYFVDHVDFMSLGLPSGAPSREAFSTTWGAGWSSLMPFTLNGVPCQLAYNSTSGLVHFDQMAANAQGAVTAWSATWGAGFTDMIPYYINNYPQFIAYNRTNGQAHFDSFPSNLQGPIIRAIRTWPTGLTSIVPFVMNGSNYFLLYNATTGAVRFDLVNASGDNSSTVWSGTWGAGFTDFVSYSINDYPYLVAYNASNGVVHYDRIASGLNGVEVKATGTLATGLKLRALATRGPAAFLAYKTGASSLHRMAMDGTGSAPMWKPSLLSSATGFVPFVQDGKTYALLYNQSSGAVKSYELTLF